jgi:hypothetical protein
MDILKLEILSPDLDKTEQFYYGLLGLNIVAKSDAAISFRAGNSEITFIYTAVVKPIYHVAFNIPNNKLDEALNWMSNKVEIIDAEPGSKIADFVNWNAKSFYFYDYTGNILEFIARFEVDNKSEAAFNGSSITSISEIGLAVDDVVAQCDSLCNAYNLQAFSKQPRLPNFAAMGDDNGLLILSAVNRMWHLTKHPAQKYHTRMLVRNSNKVESICFYVDK